METPYSKFTIYGNFVDGRRQFPLDTETIGAMQNNTMLTAVLGHIVGADRVILCGCKGNPRSEGYVWVKSDYTPETGEILHYGGGGSSSQQYCYVGELTEDLEVEDETYSEAYSTRFLADADDSWGDETMRWDSFTRIEDAMTLKKLKDLVGSGQTDFTSSINSARTALEDKIAQERRERTAAIEQINAAIGNNAEGDEQSTQLINGSIAEVQGVINSMNSKLTSLKYDLDINVKESNKYRFLPGQIMLWYGRARDVPNGWVVCDGRTHTVGDKTYTTPDLRGKFVLGATAALANGIYTDNNQGFTGGAQTVTLETRNLPAHNHTATCSTSNPHKHRVFHQGWRAVKDNGGQHVASETLVQGDDPEVVGYTSEDGTHSHTITINNTGSGQSFSIMPPYCALHYIMKI